MHPFVAAQDVLRLEQLPAIHQNSKAIVALFSSTDLSGEINN